jgi:Xaa-Pro dipeptidase
VLGGTLGMEERTPFVFANEIAAACPHLKLIDATPVIAGCRMIKSPAELALMRLACAITLQVYEAVWKSAHPGMTTLDFSDLCAQAYARVGFAGEAGCQTGIYSALPHGSLTPQIIEENQIVLIDDGCIVEGYQSDLSRTFVYGKPTDQMLRRFNIVHRAQAAALAAARPGVACEAVDAAARKVVSDAGFGPDYRYFTHRVGHGIGMDMHEWTYLVRGNTTRLQSNMTFSDEPGIYVPGEFGVRLEDDMVITADGAELLTPQSSSLEHPFGS